MPDYSKLFKDDFEGVEPPKQAAPKSAWRSFVDGLTGRDWGNTADVVSDAVQRGLGDFAGTAAQAIQTTPGAALINPRQAIQSVIDMANGRSPVGEAISNTIDQNSQPQPQDKGDVYAGRVARSVAGNAPFIPEAPAAAVLSGVGMGAGGQLGRDIGGDTGDTIGTLIGGAAGGAGGFARNIRTGLRIRDGMSNPDFNRALDITVNSESGGNPDAVSPKGAKGTMQVMDATARDPGHGIRPSDGSPQDTARVGRQLFAALLSKYGHDYEKTWAAYNWGEGNLDRAIKAHGDNWFDHAPAETQNYVAKNMTALRGGPSVGASSEQASVSPADSRIAQDQELMADNVVPFPKTEQPDIQQTLRDTINKSLDTPDNRALTDITQQWNDLTEKLKNREISIEDYDKQIEPLQAAHTAILKRLDQNLQEYDASAPTTPLDNTGYEKHTPYIEQPPEPANDTNVHSLADAKMAKDLKVFHVDLMSKVKDKAEAIRKIVQNIRDKGLLPYEIGDRFSTNKSRENGQGSWKVIGHYADPKDPERYGYRVERGSGDDYESSLMLVSDPKADARLKQMLPDFNRAKDVEGWQKMGITGEAPELPPVERDPNPPAQSGSFGTRGPQMRNRAEPVKAPEGHGEEPSPYEGLDPEEKLVRALSDAKPASAETRRLYKEARKANAAKLASLQQEGGGVAGFYKQLGALKGSLPKAEYESIAKHFTEDDANTLVNRINFNNHLEPHEKVKAQEALLKLLGAEGAKIPTPGEIRLLSEIFSSDFIKSLMEHRTLATKIWDGIKDSANLMRTLMSTFDLSAPFRQGVFMVGRKQFWTSFVKMFHLFGSEKAYQALREEIRSRPTYKLMKEGNLAVKDTNFIENREENFMSHWIEKVPVIGHIVRASDRAYTGFLHKVRADVFDDLIRKGEDVGINWHDDTKSLKQLANYINAATGRGSLGKFEQSAPILNAVFFSPRLITSRLKLMNPLTYTDPRLNPFVRKEAVKDLVKFAGIATTVLALAKAGGAQVSMDPRSADFAKIKVGNVRLDVLGGFQQFFRTAYLINPFNHTYVDGKGEEQPFGKYGGKTKKDILERFMESKLSPPVSLVKDYLDGKDATGQPFTVKGELATRYYSLFIQDFIDATKDSGAKGAALATPGVFGVGVQTYAADDRSAKGDNEFAKMFQQDFGKDFSSEFSKDFNQKDFQ
jgi:hypothetical protein